MFCWLSLEVPEDTSSEKGNQQGAKRPLAPLSITSRLCRSKWVSVAESSLAQTYAWLAVAWCHSRSDPSSHTTTLFQQRCLQTPKLVSRDVENLIHKRENISRGCLKIWSEIPVPAVWLAAVNLNYKSDAESDKLHYRLVKGAIQQQWMDAYMMLFDQESSWFGLNSGFISISTTLWWFTGPLREENNGQTLHPTIDVSVDTDGTSLGCQGQPGSASPLLLFRSTVLPPCSFWLVSEHEVTSRAWECTNTGTNLN